MLRSVRKTLCLVLAAFTLLAALAGCQKKPNIVKTEEGKLLTAHAWETNYFSHSEAVFRTDGTMTVSVDNGIESADVDGKWSIEGTTLTTVISKKYDENGDLVENKEPTVYTFAAFMNDEIIDNGDESIKKAREENEKGTEWYVSDKYLYFAGSVWVAKKQK